MIQEIQLQNFQSHADTRLELDPGMNVIIGASDSGKTAIIRALRWVTWNRPAGEAFRSHWGGDTVVKILTETDQVVREKGKDNRYVLVDPKSGGLIGFTAFGQDVPDEIRDALNLDEINLQSQLDRPFLLDSSAGEVAAHFNRVANLDQIDTATKNIAGWIRALEQTMRTLEIQDKQLQQDISSYQYLEKMEMDVDVLEDMQGDLDRFRKQHTALNTLVDNLTGVQSDIEDSVWCEQAEKDLRSIEEMAKQYDSANTKKMALISIINKLTGVEAAIPIYEHKLGAEKVIDSLLVFQRKRDQISEKGRAIQKTILDFQQTIKTMAHEENMLKQQEEKFHANFPDTCPLCDTVIKKKNATNKK